MKAFAQACVVFLFVVGLCYALAALVGCGGEEFTGVDPEAAAGDVVHPDAGELAIEAHGDAGDADDSAAAAGDVVHLDAGERVDAIDASNVDALASMPDAGELVDAPTLPPAACDDNAACPVCTGSIIAYPCCTRGVCGCVLRGEVCAP